MISIPNIFKQIIIDILHNIIITKKYTFFYKISNIKYKYIFLISIYFVFDSK